MLVNRGTNTRGRIGRRQRSLDDRVRRTLSEYGGDNPVVAASGNAGYTGESEQIDGRSRSVGSPRTGLRKVGRLHRGAMGSASCDGHAERRIGRGLLCSVRARGSCLRSTGTSASRPAAARGSFLGHPFPRRAHPKVPIADARRDATRSACSSGSRPPVNVG